MSGPRPSNRMRPKVMSLKPLKELIISVYRFTVWSFTNAQLMRMHVFTVVHLLSHPNTTHWLGYKTVCLKEKYQMWSNKK